MSFSQLEVIHCTLLWLHYPVISFMFFTVCFFVTQPAYYTQCLSEWQQLYTYPSSLNQWKGVWKAVKLMACCKMSGFLNNSRADKRQPEKQFMEKPVIYEDVEQLNDSAGILTGPQLNNKKAMVEIRFVLQYLMQQSNVVAQFRKFSTYCVRNNTNCLISKIVVLWCLQCQIVM